MGRLLLKFFFGCNRIKEHNFELLIKYLSQDRLDTWKEKRIVDGAIHGIFLKKNRPIYIGINFSNFVR